MSGLEDGRKNEREKRNKKKHTWVEKQMSYNTNPTRNQVSLLAF